MRVCPTRKLLPTFRCLGPNKSWACMNSFVTHPCIHAHSALFCCLLGAFLAPIHRQNWFLLSKEDRISLLVFLRSTLRNSMHAFALAFSSRCWSSEFVDCQGLAERGRPSSRAGIDDTPGLVAWASAIKLFSVFVSLQRKRKKARKNRNKKKNRKKQEREHRRRQRILNRLQGAAQQ